MRNESNVHHDDQFILEELTADSLKQAAGGGVTVEPVPPWQGIKWTPPVFPPFPIPTFPIIPPLPVFPPKQMEPPQKIIA
jgi:hypothetical protein